jgi:mRNA interferase YafQ
MKYTIKPTSRFQRDLKRVQKRGYDISLIKNIIKQLANGESLSEKNRDHALSGNFKGCRECHITPDWLLIYEVDNGELILYLTRTGTHSDLFDL